MWGRGFSKLYISIILPWLFLFTANTFSEEFFLYWKYSTDVDIHTDGIALTDNVTEFPLLVRLNSSNFNFSQTKGDGTDIRFIKPDGSALPYEIERWDSAGQLAEIWVKVDTVYRNNNTQYLTMYWGDNDAPDISNPKAVFDTANDFAAVWHLHDDFLDASANSNNATNSGSKDTTGTIANGQDFYGGADYLNAGSDPSLDNLNTLTFSAWIYPIGWGEDDYGRIFNKEGAAPNYGTVNFIVANAGGSLGVESLKFGRYRNTTHTLFLAPNNSLALDTWAHVVVTMNGTSSTKLYINGNEVVSYVTKDLGEGSLVSDASYDLYIGNRRTGGTGSDLDRAFDGFIDEPRVSNSVRSGDWIKLCYQTQNSAQTVVTVNASTSAAKIILHPLSDNVTAGQIASFTVDAVGEPDPSFQWQKNGTDLPGDTLATHSIPSVAEADAGDYRAIAINSGGTDTSNIATLSVVSDKPQITQHPVSVTVEVNSPASFTVTASGNPAPGFIWLKDGVLLPGETDDTLSIPSAQFSHAGKYRAIAWYGVDSATSNEATLVVYDSSVIQVHPVDDTVLAGQEAQFFIIAVGGGLSYQWQLLGTVWNDLSGETVDTIKIAATPAEDGNNYRCVATSGPIKDTSSHAVLTIATVPAIISALPTDTAIGVGSDMTFTAAATAKPNAVYTWYMKPILTDDSTEVGTDAILTMTGITKQDTGYYFFKADNRFGITFSTTVQLFVKDPVSVVSDLPAKYYVINGGAAVLGPDVIGEGDITYQWYENSVLMPGKTASSLSINPVDSATQDGNTYYCSISNTFNTYPISTVTTRVCTLTVSRYSNPFKVKAERVDIHNTTQVRMKLWSDVDISNFPSTSSIVRWADSVWVLYKTFGYTNNPAEAAVAMFSIDDIKNATDTLQKVLTTGKLPTQHDSSFYFNYSVLWHDPSLSIDTLLMPLSQANKVFMIDTLAPSNVLTVHGEYKMFTDTALIIIDSIAKLDPVADSLVILQVSNMEQFDPIIFQRELDIPTLIAGGPSSTVIMDNIGTLPLELDTLYCRWYIFAKSGAVGIPADTSFTIGWPRPVYTGTLAADSTEWGGQLQLTWDAPGTPVDSIRVWWDADTIPLNFEFTLPISQAQYMVPYSIHDTIKEGLDNDKYYWVGLQVFRDMMWSRVTPASRAFAKTALGDTSKVPNIISCDSSWFEDSTNTMVIQWHIDTMKAPGGRTYQAGYIYGLDTDSVVDTNNTVYGWIDLTQKVNITRIQLYPDIVFDTVYSVGLWLRGYSQTLGQGKKSEPTDSSFTQVRIPAFTWQYVTFFNGEETVSAANQKIILKSINDFTTSDTLWAFNPNLLLPGIEPVGGVHFRFGNPQLQIASIILGLTYDSLPTGVTPNDLRMYQWNEGLHVRHGSWVDSVAVWDTVQMADLLHPFLVLADTVAPTISITQAYNDTVLTGPSIPTWFGINDNIMNPSWQFLYGPGHEGYTYSINGYAGAYNDTTLKAMILNQGNVINESFGVRALIVANDNIRSDTLNVSRSVRAAATEAISVTAHEWVPLRSTAGLDAPALGDVFTRSIGDGTAWEYDIHNYRLYRWYDGAGTGQNSWLEYSDPVKDVFAFEPGRLIWFKSLENQTVTFGPGVTTSLKEAYEIVLAPKNWTDITLPYQFPVMLRDILEATGSSNDMLEVYHWMKNDKIYEGVDLYIASLDSVSSVTDTIQSKQMYDGYTVYNHSTAPVTLRIPPISLTLSNYAGGKRKKAVQSDHTWNIHFMWKNLNDGKESFFRRLRCGFRKSESKKRLSGFLPPTMSKIQVGITDPQRNTLHGWALEPSLANGGISFTVNVTNSSDKKAKIAYYLDNLGVLPDDFVAGMLDPKTHKYEDCTPKKAAEVTIGAKSSTQRVIVIGTKAYLENMIIGYLPMKLVKAFPNPFNGKIRIQYRIPIGISEVRFTLFNLRGQQIWRGIERKNLMPGRHTYFFDSRAGKKNALPAGVYIMRMTAKNKKGKVLYGGKRKLTCIK